MKKSFYLIILFLLGLVIITFSVPRKYTVYNDWSDIRLVDTLMAHQISDTVLAIRTNREFAPDRAEFFACEISESRFEYLVVTFKNGIWWVDLVQDIGSAVYYFPERDLVVYVEGMGKTFPVSLQRSAAMSAQYNVNVIMFDYPSVHPDKSMIGNFHFAYERAEMSGVHYKNFLKDVKKVREENSIHQFTLFHHSMGNLILKELANEDLADLKREEIFNNLVINAACVPQKNHKEWVEKLSIADRIYISYNKGDFQLNGAMLLTFKKMLGARFSRPLAENAVYVDFHPLVNKRHSNFLNIKGRENIQENAYNFYYSILHGGEASLQPPLQLYPLAGKVN